METVSLSFTFDFSHRLYFVSLVSYHIPAFIRMQYRDRHAFCRVNNSVLHVHLSAHHIRLQQAIEHWGDKHLTPSFKLVRAEDRLLDHSSRWALRTAFMVSEP